MIATVTLNPALDKCIYIDELHPHDVNRITKIEIDAGGKGVNASRVLKELGSHTTALGFVGGRIGSFVEHVLKGEGIHTDFVHLESETRTNICVQETSGAPPTTFNEPGSPIPEAEVERLCVKIRKVAKRSSMIIFGGSLPTGAPDDIYRKLVTIAREEGVRSILDSDGEPMRLGMQASPYMIKPNRDEAERLVGVKIETLEDAVRALGLLAESGIEVAVISMGSRGSVACSGSNVWQAIPPEVKVVSTIGSGDSMVAGMAHILSWGGSLDEALRWGTAAGAATAMTDGTEICRRQQVLDLLEKVRIERLK
jgi:1-phosphofructokinase family hexose kinase